MSDLITLMPPGDPGEDPSDPGGGESAIIAEGIDTENPKSYASRNMSAANLRDYAACLAYGLANEQLQLAEQIYTLYKNLKAGDQGHFQWIRDLENNKYDAQHYCAMSIAKTAVASSIGQKLKVGLANTGMYAAGIKRALIESSYSSLVDEAAPVQALMYRDEFGLDDKTYMNNRQNLVASIDRSNMYVATRALASVADTQVDLALFAADARNTYSLNQIDAVVKLVSNVENLVKEGENSFFKPKPSSGAGTDQGGNTASIQRGFGTQSVVRPDNPEGFNPPVLVPPPAQAGTSTGGEFTSTPGGVGGV